MSSNSESITGHLWSDRKRICVSEGIKYGQVNILIDSNRQHNLGQDQTRSRVLGSEQGFSPSMNELGHDRSLISYNSFFGTIALV